METQPGISLKNRPYFIDSVKWNDDGQLVVCTDSHVHIMTPILTGVSSKKDNYTHVGIHLPPFEKKVDYNIIADPNDIQTSYLNDEGFRCVNWSPINLSPNQSCFLVVVTTKHRVLLYQNSTKDTMNSDWQLYLDITGDVEENTIQHTHATRKNPHHTLYASWSRILIPNPLATASALLALSNKAGDLSIWTYSLHNQVQYVTSITPHKSFVSLLSWTNWKRVDQDKSIAYVVSACTDGTVAISSISAKYFVNGDNQSIVQDIKVENRFLWFEDQRSVNTLVKTFDNFENGKNQIKIAVSKGISVQFISLNVDNDGNLQIEKDWTCYDLENSALGLAGGSWINETEFRCYTIEGEGLQIRFDTDVQQSEEVHSLINTRLIQKYKQQWMEEQIKAGEDDLMVASDATPYLWGAADGLNHIFTSIYFSMRLTADIHYKFENLEDSFLAFILQKDRGVDINNLYEDINKYVNDIDFFFTKPFRGLIRELMEYLIDDDNLEPFNKWVSTLIYHIENKQSLSDDGLTRAIYSEPSTIAARILINTEIELKHYNTNKFGVSVIEAFKLARNVVKINFSRNLLTYALHLPKERIERFGDQDVMVLLLLADLALNLQDEDLVKQCLSLYMLLQDNIPNLNLNEEIDYSKNYNLNEPTLPFKKAREKCPVCDEFVNLIDDSLFAQCNTGHFWEICSVTKRVLYKPNTRKCVTCGAKSLQLNGDDSLTDIILTNCSKCVVCGSGLL